MSDPTGDDVSTLRHEILANQRVIDELNKTLSRKSQEVRIIQEIASEMNATNDLDAILSIILHSMDKVFGFKHSMILLTDELGTSLKVAASRGYEDAGVGAEVPVGQGVIGMVAKKRRLMRMGNIGSQVAYVSAVRSRMQETGAELPDVPTLPGLKDVQSQVAIPLMIKDRLVGVFAVESAATNVFDDKDEMLIAILANQAASAIHKARLYRDAERANEELREFNETLEEKVRLRTDDLSRAQSRLVQSEKMASLGMLVAGIAHEINTPIGSIQSMHDTLFRALDKVRASLDVELPGWQERPKLKPLFAMIGDSSKVLRSGTERVTTIVKRLKSFARLDEAELKQVDIHEGIEDTLSLIGHELRGVSLVRQYGGLPRVTCYPGRLNQVFLNVLMNARQALKDGTGEIAVSTQQAEGRARIVIRDDGSGIAPEDLPRVFDPGFTTKGVGVGTGLGLSICYQIMEEHTGEIRIESELGVGTSVTIGLPIDGPKKKES